MYTLCLIARNKNHVPDGYQTEKLPQGLRKANACGGGVRPNEPLGACEATSNEAGNPPREGRNPRRFQAIGRMSNETPFHLIL